MIEECPIGIDCKLMVDKPPGVPEIPHCFCPNYEECRVLATAWGFPYIFVDEVGDEYEEPDEDTHLEVDFSQTTESYFEEYQEGGIHADLERCGWAESIPFPWRETDSIFKDDEKMKVPTRIVDLSYTGRGRSLLIGEGWAEATTLPYEGVPGEKGMYVIQNWIDVGWMVATPLSHRPGWENKA